MKILKINAFAKLNLGLQVLNKRTDGFHNINTIFIRTSLSDEIIISESKGLNFECISDMNIPNEENLAFRATILLLEKYNIKNANINIQLTKNIPSGAGLGGGSSDASAVLTGLVKFLKLPYKYHDLYKIACSLGSDVPYFLKNGTATATGRGEILSYFRHSLPFLVLLVFPGNHVPTKWAYQSLNKTTNPERPIDFRKILKLSENDIHILKRALFNDFEIPVFEKYPEIGKIKEKLYEHDSVYAQMSGSGSTVFGLFETLVKAEKASKLFSNYKTFIYMSE